MLPSLPGEGFTAINFPDESATANSVLNSLLAGLSTRRKPSKYVTPFEVRLAWPVLLGRFVTRSTYSPNWLKDGVSLKRLNGRPENTFTIAPIWKWPKGT